MAESLQCAADIIDTDCKPAEGQTIFDNWLKGLAAVQAKLCSDNQLNVFLESPCFNIEDFLNCVESSTQVTHVVDLLKVILSKNECNRILIAVPTCSVRAHAAHSVCFTSQEIINDVLFTFISHTQCGQDCALAARTVLPTVPLALMPLLLLR